MYILNCCHVLSKQVIKISDTVSGMQSVVIILTHGIVFSKITNYTQKQAEMQWQIVIN